MEEQLWTLENCQEACCDSPQLLAVHAITGCDTVAQLPGIGKITAIKTLLAG